MCKDINNSQSSNDGKVNELRRYYLYLKTNTSTNCMASHDLEIPEKHLTRYKRLLEKEGKLRVVKPDYCERTGHLAGYLTTDENKFPANDQLSLF
ncbi:hypothetical protein EI427_05625 [Flammeovirga pectinis]|uniref:Uncharacterized protein n=1 Tax=Flammeovirga pectinis TaxID=2494373 RepID=A0A3S9P0L8_9BACT|nr:hypothetical protein [Flammeovirga pectinis]AZQ61731.1 hypothetical protein EI427_05625 [Flammeovirga pectinis]